MALVAEALGTVVPGVAGTPAADSRLLEAAHGTGRLVVALVAADRRPRDEISLDVPRRTLTLEVSEEELQRRRPNAATLAGLANPTRGWERLYMDHGQQADTGADLDFLVGAAGDRVSRESHKRVGLSGQGH
jgi:dihydroxy-acid dehydratase